MVKHARRKSATRAAMKRTGKSFTAQTRARQALLGHPFSVPSIVKHIAEVGEGWVWDVEGVGGRHSLTFDPQRWLRMAEAGEELTAQSLGIRSSAPDGHLRLAYAARFPDFWDNRPILLPRDAMPWQMLFVRGDGSIASDHEGRAEVRQFCRDRAHAASEARVREVVQDHPELAEAVLPDRHWPRLTPGLRLVFRGNGWTWRVTQVSETGRYVLVERGGRYSILDLDEGIRGALGVIGGGVPREERNAEFMAGLESGENEVSHRNRVPLVFASVEHQKDLTVHLMPLLDEWMRTMEESESPL